MIIFGNGNKLQANQFLKRFVFLNRKVLIGHENVTSQWENGIDRSGRRKFDYDQIVFYYKWYGYGLHYILNQSLNSN